jgi:hypothetical protein
MEAALRTMGDQLIALGRSPQAEFLSIIQASLQRGRVQEIEMIEKMLQFYGGKPHFWVQDMQRRRAALQAALREPPAPVPSNVTAKTPEEAAALFQRVVRQYGELLTQWPAIVSAGKELRAAGKGLAGDPL